MTPDCLLCAWEKNQNAFGKDDGDTEQSGEAMPPQQPAGPAGLLGQSVPDRWSYGWSDVDHSLLEHHPCRRPPSSPTMLTTALKAAFPLRSA